MLTWGGREVFSSLTTSVYRFPGFLEWTKDSCWKKTTPLQDIEDCDHGHVTNQKRDMKIP